VAAPLAVVVGDTLPHGAVEQLTVQLTPLLAGSPVTVAVKLKVAPARTVAVPGAMETVIPGTVTVAAANAAAFVTELAVIVTPKSPAGGVLGAV
jgi:hypothetical protein